MNSSRLLILSSVSGAHCVLLALGLMMPAGITPPVALPTVQGMLVSTAAATAAEPQRPRESPSPPPSLRQQQVSPSPSPLPAPPSERAITAPVAEAAPARAPESPAAPLPPAATATASARGSEGPSYSKGEGGAATAGVPDAPVAPLIPPRVDAGHLNNPAPVYPPASRRLGEQGKVLLDVLIRPDGTVGEIRLRATSRYPRLDTAALNAVKRWRYVPARRGNTPIAYWYVQPIVFSLQ